MASYLFRLETRGHGDKKYVWPSEEVLLHAIKMASCG